MVGSGFRSYLALMKNIYVEYVDAEFEIEFEKPFLFLTLPSIVFRSILGSQLHSIACIARQNTCRSCQFNKSCIYSTIFETILDKNTVFLPGRDKGSHPFRIKIKETFQPDNPYSRIFLTVQLYGFAIQYLPYIFYALQRAGDRGLFKERAVYKIKSVKVNNENILKSDGNLNTDFFINSWEYEANNDIAEKAQRICIKTPLRFKVGGKYKKDFSAQDFLLCVHRRLITLSSLYGKYELKEIYTPSPDIKISEAELKWKDYSYHSHRQEKIISLGGIEGSFLIKGRFTDYENHLLNFTDIFGAGKNTNFGLGNIELL